MLSRSLKNLVNTLSYEGIDRLIPIKKTKKKTLSLLKCLLFQRHVPLDSRAVAGDNDEKFPAVRQTAILPAARHLRFRGSSSEWSGQSA